MEITMDSLLEIARDVGASDVHITVGLPPKMRVNGTIEDIIPHVLTSHDTQTLVLSIMNERQVATLKRDGEADFSYSTEALGRFRCNVFRQKNSFAAVLRLINTVIPAPEKLGLPWSVMDLAKRKRGLVLVTGPTGSGKSTTLYTAVNERNHENINIITVEDPVEANVDGVSQVQVNAKADLTFASALRSILRQDPDVIMIGEIRDRETASIAVQASITGHLVLSTLHTNDAPGTMTRLMDMGVESYLLADAMRGVIAQRLVRRLCPHCKKKRKALGEEKGMMGINPMEEVEIYEPVGCEHCNDTGFYGRTGIYEMMPVTSTLRNAIAARMSTDEIREVAVKEGMKTLHSEAVRLVLEGETSYHEMIRISLGE